MPAWQGLQSVARRGHRRPTWRWPRRTGWPAIRRPPMTGPEPRSPRCSRAACRAELEALKPGNVHAPCRRPRHDRGRLPAQRRGRGAARRATRHWASAAGSWPRCEATRAACGQNTNLGILLLAHRWRRRPRRGGELRASLRRRARRASTGPTPALAYRAIRLAAPGGLGTQRRSTTSPSEPDGHPARGHAGGRRARPDRACSTPPASATCSSSACRGCAAVPGRGLERRLGGDRDLPGVPRPPSPTATSRASTASAVAEAVRERAAPLVRAPARGRRTRRRWRRTCWSSTRASRPEESIPAPAQTSPWPATSPPPCWPRTCREHHRLLKLLNRHKALCRRRPGSSTMFVLALAHASVQAHAPV